MKLVMLNDKMAARIRFSGFIAVPPGRKKLKYSAIELKLSSRWVCKCKRTFIRTVENSPGVL